MTRELGVVRISRGLQLEESKLAASVGEWPAARMNQCNTDPPACMLYTLSQTRLVPGVREQIGSRRRVAGSVLAISEPSNTPAPATAVSLLPPPAFVPPILLIGCPLPRLRAHVVHRCRLA